MEDLADSIGKLSTEAKEWRPGMNYYGSNATGGTTTMMEPSSPNPNSIRRMASVDGKVPPPPPPMSPRFSPSMGSALHPSPPGKLGIQRADSSGFSTNWADAKEFVPHVENSSNGAWSSSPSPASATAAVKLQQVSHNGTSFFVQPPLTPSLEPSLEYDTANTLTGEQWWGRERPQAATMPSAPSSSEGANPGLPNSLWSFHRALALESLLREMEPNDPRHKAVPSSFTQAFPLDQSNSSSSSTTSFGYPSSVFKVTNKADGQLYCLRRLDNAKCVSHKIAEKCMEKWINFPDHPNVCRFHRCFVSQRAVFFLHGYHPGARTMKERFLDNMVENGTIVPERLIWSIIIQILAALRVIHSQGLSCRSLQPNHILCLPSEDPNQPHVRIKINCIGIADALEFESRKPTMELQKEDMRCLGRIILCLSSRTMIFPNSDKEILRRCELFFARNYSAPLHGLTVALLARRPNPPTLAEVWERIAPRILEEHDTLSTKVDFFSNSLAKEYESGRAMRLLLKLGFVNERPSFAFSERWSETGDCYVLKLFRDYVFHQSDAEGRPVMDLGHVITAMNKLDAAAEEKIVLTSRDGKSLLVVSFADVARCLEGAYGELASASKGLH